MPSVISGSRAVPAIRCATSNDQGTDASCTRGRAGLPVMCWAGRRRDRSRSYRAREMPVWIGPGAPIQPPGDVPKYRRDQSRGVFVVVVPRPAAHLERENITPLACDDDQLSYHGTWVSGVTVPAADCRQLDAEQDVGMQWPGHAVTLCPAADIGTG